MQREDTTTEHRSTGPRTPEGKLTCAMNSLRHGICSNVAIMPSEDAGEYYAILNSLFEQYAPTNVQEEILLQNIVKAIWFQLRAQRAEELFVHHLATVHPADWTDSQVANLDRISRYRTSHERSYHRNLKLLTTMQSERRKLEQAATEVASVQPPQQVPAESAQQPTIPAAPLIPHDFASDFEDDLLADLPIPKPSTPPASSFRNFKIHPRKLGKKRG